MNDALMKRISCQIWYQKPDMFVSRDYDTIDPGNLISTHVLLQNMENISVPINWSHNEVLSDMFVAFQGENWSPNGEMRDFIREKQLGHTSMSVGDIIVIDGCVYICHSFGWSILR